MGLQRKKIQKIRDYNGSEWVGPGLTRNYFFKSSQNSPKAVQIFWSSIPCVFCLYTLLKVVGYNDCSLLSMSEMGFQKSLDGVGRSIQFFFLIFEFF